MDWKWGVLRCSTCEWSYGKRGGSCQKISMPALEIEAKFVYELKAISKTLAAHNAQFLGTKTFLDTYYDFSDKKLALRNVWLRKRHDTWELKTGNCFKALVADAAESVNATYYQERSGELDISKALDEYDFFSGYETFDSKLRLLQPLAIIETTRTSYRLNDHTKIDLDDARLIPTSDLERKDPIQYSIGEVEIMVYDEGEMESTHNERVEKELQNVRQELNVTTPPMMLSKLDRYFQEYLPDFFKAYPYRS